MCQVRASALLVLRMQMKPNALSLSLVSLAEKQFLMHTSVRLMDSNAVTRSPPSCHAFALTLLRQYSELVWSFFEVGQEAGPHGVLDIPQTSSSALSVRLWTILCLSVRGSRLQCHLFKQSWDSA